jgi:hypothetical protein
MIPRRQRQCGCAPTTDGGTDNSTKHGTPPVVQGHTHATYKLHCEPLDEARVDAAELGQAQTQGAVVHHL